ncbi:MAG: ABC transporter permease [Gemmataceae bacterium]
MDAATVIPKVRFNRFLPYWAVLRTDIRQVTRSWAYWLWVGLFVVISSAHVIYRYALANGAGFTTAPDGTGLNAAAQTSNVIQLILQGSLAVVAFLSVSSISGERSTVADAVLSRGISRYAYFMAKWHARVITVLGTFIFLSLGVLLVYRMLLGEGGLVGGISYIGSVLGVVMVAAGMGIVVSWGVTIGAMSPSTLMGITIAWLVLYGGLSIMFLLPEGYPTPREVLSRLQDVFQGNYNMDLVWRVLGVSTLVSFAAAAVGLLTFSRKDV